MKKQREYHWPAVVFHSFIFTMCLHSWEERDPKHKHPCTHTYSSCTHTLVALVGRKSVRQTDRQTDRNTVTDILKYWTMRHSKFVFQPRDLTVWPRINTHKQASPCSILYSRVCVCVCVCACVCVLCRDAGMSGWGRRLIPSRWCNQTGRVGSQWAHVQPSLWSRLVIPSVANGHLIQNRVVNS